MAKNASLTVVHSKANKSIEREEREREREREKERETYIVCFSKYSKSLLGGLVVSVLCCGSKHQGFESPLR